MRRGGIRKYSKIIKEDREYWKSAEKRLTDLHAYVKNLSDKALRKEDYLLELNIQHRNSLKVSQF